MTGDSFREHDRDRSLLRRLGWGHHGFRVANQRNAVLGLCLLLLPLFLLDQAAFQKRMAEHEPDLKQWRQIAAQQVSDPSRPVYQQHGRFYLYPPFFLALIWPLSQVPPWLAALIFEACKWVAIVLSLRIAWRMCSPPGEDVPPIVALGTIVASWRFIWNDLGQGNVDILICLGVLGGCWLLMRGHHYLAGATIAAVACVKVTPALLLVYFIYKGWWRTLIGAALGAAFCLLLWPALWYGWAGNLELLYGWYDAVIAGFIAHGGVNSIHTNQSLVAVLNRLFGPHVAIRPDVYLTIIELPLWLRNGIRIIVAGGVLAGLGYVCRVRLRPALHGPALTTEVGLVLIAMLILSGYSWKAHFVIMILPYAALLARLADARFQPGKRRLLAWLLAISFVLGTLTSDIITPTGANYAEAYGSILLSAVVAGAGLWVMRAELRFRGRMELDPEGSRQRG